MFPSKADRKAQNRVGNRLRFLQHAARLRKGIFDPRPDPACRPLKRRQSPGPLCASEAVRAQLFPGFDLDPLPPGLDRLLEGPARGSPNPASGMTLKTVLPLFGENFEMAQKADPLAPASLLASARASLRSRNSAGRGFFCPKGGLRASPLEGRGHVGGELAQTMGIAAHLVVVPAEDLYVRDRDALRPLPVPEGSTTSMKPVRVCVSAASMTTAASSPRCRRRRSVPRCISPVLRLHRGRRRGRSCLSRHGR